MARRKQQALPGLEKQTIPELEEAMAGYTEARDEWVAKRTDVQDAKAKLLELAAKHGVSIYRDESHDPPLLLSIAETKSLKVKVMAPELDEDDGEEPQP